MRRHGFATWIPVALVVLFAAAAAVYITMEAGRKGGGDPTAPVAMPREVFPGETRLKNVRQLTFGGENAEAYWSFDEKRLVFQSTRPPFEADQIFVMGADGRDVRLVSTGLGRTTCAYFLPGDERILFSSTHAAGKDPPPPPPQGSPLGYVWPIYNSYDVYTVRVDGTDLRPLVQSPGYDAEATVSPAGDRIVFTSTRDGDLDLYSCALDGSDVRRLTSSPGYDGGAFFSWDGKRIVWRAPARTDVDLEETKTLLARELVRPTKLEIWVMDADGGNPRQVTRNGGANFGPFWHPDGRRVIYSSNAHDPQGGNFELYLVDVETGESERITHFERRRPGARRSDDFDGFPMFTRDGKRLVWCSNRYNDRPNETNVFVADW
jgi:Tol biopolymer transport system component